MSKNVRLFAIIIGITALFAGAGISHAQYYSYPYGSYPYNYNYQYNSANPYSYGYGSPNITYGNGTIYNYWGNGPVSGTTLPATFIAGTTATLNGSVSSNDPLGYYRFEYGTTPTLGVQTEYVSVAGNSQANVSYNIVNLAPRTTYYFRIVARNNFGNGVPGQILSFTTGDGVGSAVSGGGYAGSSASLNGAQTARTEAAYPVGSGSATLNGSVNPGGRDATYFFEYGTTPDLDRQTLERATGSGASDISVSADISNLRSGTTYYYRVGAKSSLGITVGDVLSFTTRGGGGAASGGATGGTVANSGLSSPDASGVDDTKTPAITNAYSPKNSFGMGARILSVFGAKPAPCLTLSGTVSDKTVAPGEAVRYAVSGANNCSVDFTNAVLRITISDRATLASSSSPFAGTAGSTYIYDLGNFSNLSKLNVTISVVVDEAAEDGTPIPFTATLDFVDSGSHEVIGTTSSVAVSTPILTSLLNAFRSSGSRTSNISGSQTGDSNLLNLFLVVVVAGLIVWVGFGRRKAASKPKPFITSTPHH